MGSGGPQQFGGLEDLLGSLTGGRSGTAGSSGAGAQGGLGGMLGSGGSGGGLASIAMAVLSMLMSQRGGRGSSGGLGGGLGGLLEKLQQGGLGNQTRSWVEPGQNESISATQVRDALGDDTVNDVAARAGVSREEAADGLAGLLPQLVDRLTPEGRVPDENQLQGMLGGLAPK